MHDNDRVESLILLVGSNPLPNYLAAMALKRSVIHLVHSEETKGPKDRLHTALHEALNAELGLNVTIDGDAYVDDPFSASAVGDKLARPDPEELCRAPALHGRNEGDVGPCFENILQKGRTTEERLVSR